MIRDILENNTLKLILIIIFSIIISISISNISSEKYCKNKFSSEMVTTYENNKNSNFEIKQILVYSSADAEDRSAGNYLQDIAISSYSDIAVYIDNNSVDGLSEENTINELYVDNIKFETKLDNANLKFGYKNPTGFGAISGLEQYENDRIDFKIIHSNSENKNFNEPIFFTDCSNPLTFGFVNYEILQHFRMSQSNKLISFNGRILQDANIDLNKIEPVISFNIHLVNNVNEEYMSKVFLKLKYEDNNASIKDGYIIALDYNSLNKFIRVEK